MREMEKIIPVRKNMPEGMHPADTHENFSRLDEEIWALRERLKNMQEGLESAQNQERNGDKWKSLQGKREDLYALIADIPTRDYPEPISEEKFWLLMNRAKKILGEETYSDNVIPFEKKDKAA